ncbi:MAG: YaaL family protein [Clostridiales bacterium]|jgi:hypothetical protein|nr:YaaL family protein [Clostridiales bacterium]
MAAEINANAGTNSDLTANAKTAININSVPPRPRKQKKVKRAKQSAQMVRENNEILQILEKIVLDLNNLHNNFDQVTEPILIDSCIYEIHSLNMKYQYYLQICKDRGVAVNKYYYVPPVIINNY